MKQTLNLKCHALNNSMYIVNTQLKHIICAI